MLLAELNNNNILLWKENKRISWQDIRDDRIAYVVSERHEVFKKQSLMKRFLDRKTEQIFLSEVPACESVTEICGTAKIIDIASRLKTANLVLVTGADGRPLFVQDTPWLISEVEISGAQRDIYYKIINDIDEEIFLTDENGTVLYMNPRSEERCGLSWNQCVGQNMEDLVEQGLFPESMTLEALEKKKKVERITEMHTGRYIVSTATPLYDEDQQIQYVLCTSKDVQELNHLMRENALITTELEKSKKQVENLHNQMIAQKNYVFESPAMREVKRVITKIAPTDVTVLIEGETGTGKEVTAEMIHAMSRRSDHPMMKINCGSIPKDLLESELFGYMPGSFSGAAKEGKTGILEAADKGTIFLDEIGEMPWMLQVKLLEFLQDKKIQRIGGIKKIPIDARVVAATNRDLKKEVEEGRFRKDLFYRLNTMPIHLEPLRSRKEDIRPLAQLFLKRFNRQHCAEKRISEKVLFDLTRYEWPGNVRELMHVIERFVISAEGNEIDEDLLKEVLGKPSASQRIYCSGIFPLKNAREELDSILVHSAMRRFGSTRKAAEALGVNQSTVVRLLNKNTN